MQRKRRILRWLMFALAAVVILAGVGVWLEIPHVVSFDTLFRWSKRDMNAYAARVMAPGSTALMNPPRRLGYFNVLKVEPLPHGFLFQHDSGTLFDWCGIAYSEEPPAAVDRLVIRYPAEATWASTDSNLQSRAANPSLTSPSSTVAASTLSRRLID